MSNEKYIARVLIVDDEVDTLEFLEYNLRNKGYEVRSAANGNKAFEILKSFQPDIILLDYMMPEMDGMEFLKKFRKINPANQCLVAFLTAKNTDETQIESLELGADDFIAKPIKPNVLASRMSALLRRRQEYSKLSQNDDIRFEDVVINPESFSVTVGNEVIAFPRKEFQLLYLLAEKPGRVFRREEILQA
ncbi:MAG TPA: response regulator transcription factor, partial [Saprospiraceae bacterium]|nr:response regulator transcription factor [Saprospiraceae bacterium]